MFNCKLLIIGLVLTFSVTIAPAAQLKDPTKPPITQVDGIIKSTIRGDLSVTSIIISERGRRALINGEIVRTGDVIEGETVTAIRPGYVEVADNGLRRKLFLVPSRFKKTVSGTIN